MVAESSLKLPAGFPTTPIQSSMSWKQGSDMGDVVYAFSNEAQDEMRQYIEERAPPGVLSLDQITSVAYERKKLPVFSSEIERARPQVDSGIGFVVFPEWKGLDVHQSRVASWLVDNAFGEPAPQDVNGLKLMELYKVSEDASVKRGYRYHETSEGNSPHTDGAQVIEDPDYLCLRAVSQAAVGGGNILVSADSLYNAMLERAPDLIGSLATNFHFDVRGVTEQEGSAASYVRPIMSMDNGEMRLRFLDWYIFEGHKAADVPLTLEQRRAIDGLNCLFDESDLQFTAKLEAGQQIVFANKRLLHARTPFIDPNKPKRVYEPAQLDDLDNANRLMDRTWSHKK